MGCRARTQLAVPRAERGVALLEALVSILIFSIGILAAVGMMGTAVKNVTEAKHRTEVAFLTNKLIAQMWADSANISSYAYTGSGAVPTRLTGWIAQTDQLPAGSTLRPIITVSNTTATGGMVTIQVRWQLPQDQSQGLPPHSYTAMAAVYGN
jgi:type IV pilus assembly protein PilV